MILHPGFAELRNYTAGELTATRRGRLQRHLERCARCQGTVASIQAVRQIAREITAPPLPDALWPRISARHAAGERCILPLEDAQVAASGRAPVIASPRPVARAFRNDRTRVLRRAAVLLLAVAAITSAAVAGPPLGAWLRDAWQNQPLMEAASTQLETVPPATGDENAARFAGLAAAPHGGEVTVSVQRAAPGLHLAVRLSEGEEVEVRAYGAAADALFRSGSGWIEVGDAGAGELQIDLPRQVPRAVLRVNGALVLRKEGERLHFLATPAELAGSAVILDPGLIPAAREPCSSPFCSPLSCPRRPFRERCAPRARASRSPTPPCCSPS